VRVLRYEYKILDAEVRALNILSRIQALLRTPEVHKFDQSCTLVEPPYAIIDYIPGDTLGQCRKTLNESDALGVDQTCGRHLQFVNDVTCENSGDDRPNGSLSVWPMLDQRASFLRLAGGVLGLALRASGRCRGC
jgi:hypothetical protein